jgi:hypothetical protein
MRPVTALETTRIDLQGVETGFLKVPCHFQPLHHVPSRFLAALAGEDA